MFVADTFSVHKPALIAQYQTRGGTDARGAVYACSACGWWYIRRERERVIPIIPPVADITTAFYEAIVKRFAISDQQVPLAALRRHLEHFKADIYNVDTRVFERVIANLYADHFPGSEIRHIGGPGDNGVDIYAVINDTPCVIQVKRRASAGETEGPAVVRELVGVMFSEGVSHAHLVTTADRFTIAAHKAARREHLIRHKCHIRLLALPELLIMLCIANKQLRAAWKDAWHSCQQV